MSTNLTSIGSYCEILSPNQMEYIMSTQQWNNTFINIIVYTCLDPGTLASGLYIVDW